MMIEGLRGRGYMGRFEEYVEKTLNGKIPPVVSLGVRLTWLGLVWVS